MNSVMLGQMRFSSKDCWTLINCTPVFNDRIARPYSMTRKSTFHRELRRRELPTVKCQCQPARTPCQQELHNNQQELHDKYKGQEGLIANLKRNLLEIHEMDPNFSEPEDNAPCLTQREFLTRSTAILKKTSMNQHAQQISATPTHRAQPTIQKNIRNYRIGFASVWI